MSGPDANEPSVGTLCMVCRNLRVVRSGKGSTFLFCELSLTDPRFPKYPPQPCWKCEGFREVELKQR